MKMSLSRENGIFHLFAENFAEIDLAARGIEITSVFIQEKKDETRSSGQIVRIERVSDECYPATLFEFTLSPPENRLNRKARRKAKSLAASLGFLR